MGLGDLFGSSKNKQLEEKIKELEKLLPSESGQMVDLKQEIIKLTSSKNSLKEEIISLEKEKLKLKLEIQEYKKKLIVFDEDILYQDFALYQPIYDFANSEQYKTRLEDIRRIQKGLIKDQKAINFYDGWTVNGSKAEGKKMINNNIKQILRCFNTECEVSIMKVKYNNIDSMESRIEKSFDSLNKIFEGEKVSITQNFLNLKLDELHLAHEYELKKQEEKEEQKRINAELREQAKLERELQEAKKIVQKEQNHFQQALDKIRLALSSKNASEEQKQLLLEKEKELSKKLNEITTQLNDIDYRASNQRAGYVYIISNIGAFGENVYKIGMTRRLEPQERVDELGDASVPFNFDIHAMIFTEDAPKLENALHKAFENKKVNMINSRREFFNVTLEEIEKVVKANFDKTVEFTKIAQAQQYRESLKLKNET